VLGRTWWQLKQEDQDSGKRPVWHVLAMLVPIYGYFRFHAHMRTIAKLGATEEARSILNPLAMTVAWIVINLLSTASVMRGDVAIEVPLLVYGLCGALIGWAQYGLNSTWRSLPGGSVRARLNPLHIVLLLVGVLRHRYSTIADVRLVVANGVLLALVGLAVAGVSAVSRSSVSVEGAVRRYAAAVTSSDLDAALAEIAPSQREIWSDWLVSQLGNIYEVRGIAVRTPSLVLRGGPYEVTVVLDINREYPDEHYEPTSTEPVEQVDGTWYLSRPLLVH